MARMKRVLLLALAASLLLLAWLPFTQQAGAESASAGLKGPWSPMPAPAASTR